MTKEQFNKVKTEDNIKIFDDGNFYSVKCIYDIQGILMLQDKITKDEFPVRYENVELVLKDELVELLNEMCNYFDHSDHACIIREIVRKEVIDELKFPTIQDILDYWNKNSTHATAEWFIGEIKKLNK